MKNTRANALADRLEHGANALAAFARSLSDAPITCQFMLENHAVRHSYHHLSRLRAMVENIAA